MIIGLTVLTVLLFFIVRNYAVQIAQQGQDSILVASVTSMLDTAVIRDGLIEMEPPQTIVYFMRSIKGRICYQVMRIYSYLRCHLILQTIIKQHSLWVSLSGRSPPGG